MRSSIRRHRQNLAGAIRDDIKNGRKHYERREWADALEAFAQADRACPLGADDLQLLATSAYLAGNEGEYLRALERAHSLLLRAEEPLRAARCAFWIGLCLLFRGTVGPATGWFGRGQRLLDRQGAACAEQGYLLVPRAERELGLSQPQAAYATAGTAAEIGERFADADLTACARHIQGRALLGQGQVDEGLSLLDEAMVSVAAGELSPIMTGLVYCSVIDACMQVYAVTRAREWTEALAGWCGAQPQLLAFTGTCLVHRAEIFELNGAWPDASREAQRACAGFGRHVEPPPPAAAFYRRGELCRLRGEFAAADASYGEASRRGCDPQPGLALLRMAQGRENAATTAIRRALKGTADPLARARLVPAYVEILLAVGEVDEARSACHELEETARDFAGGALGAMAAYARGTLLLAERDPAAALPPLREACEFWRRAEAPYLMARARELVGLACRDLGDDDGARLELDVATVIFEELGAVTDVSRMASRATFATAGQSHGLTKRELQVLRLLATGKTNKAIGAELFVSQRTIDRHVSNLFGKLDLTTRAAAAAYAHRHKLA